jgi:hypothetical protein
VAGGSDHDHGGLDFLFREIRSEPMKLKRKTWRTLAAAGLALALASCEKNAMEKAGKAVDRAGEKVGDKIRDISK